MELWPGDETPISRWLARIVIHRRHTDAITGTPGVIGRVSHEVLSIVFDYCRPFTTAIVRPVDALPRLAGLKQFDRFAHEFCEIASQLDPIDDAIRITILRTVAAEIQVRRRIRVDENIGVDDGIARVEPRGVQVFVRAFGAIAHRQRSEQPLGFRPTHSAAVGHVEFTLVVLYFGRPVRRIGPGIGGCTPCVTSFGPMYQVRRNRDAESVRRVRSEQVVFPAVLKHKWVAGHDRLVADRIGVSVRGMGKQAHRNKQECKS